MGHGVESFKSEKNNTAMDGTPSHIASLQCMTPGFSSSVVNSPEKKCNKDRSKAKLQALNLNYKDGGFEINRGSIQ